MITPCAGGKIAMCRLFDTCMDALSIKKNDIIPHLATSWKSIDDAVNSS